MNIELMRQVHGAFRAHRLLRRRVYALVNPTRELGKALAAVGGYLGALPGQHERGKKMAENGLLLVLTSGMLADTVEKGRGAYGLITEAIGLFGAALSDDIGRFCLTSAAKDSDALDQLPKHVAGLVGLIETLVVFASVELSKRLLTEGETAELDAMGSALSRCVEEIDAIRKIAGMGSAETGVVVSEQDYRRAGITPQQAAKFYVAFHTLQREGLAAELRAALADGQLKVYVENIIAEAEAENGRKQSA